MALNKPRALEKAASVSTASPTAVHTPRFVPPGLVLQDRLQVILICLALFMIAMGFNLYRIGDASIWFDEALSVNRAQQSLPVLLQIVSVTQPNMALYYFVLHFWLSFVSLFGLHATEAVVRFPSAVFAAMGPLVVYFLARRFWDSFVAVFAAVLYLLNTLQLTYAQETRAYSLQLLFLGLSWYALCILFSCDLSNLSKKRARNWWICFVITSALAVYSHLFTELVLAAQGVAIAILCVVPTAWRERVRRQLRPLVISWICIGVLIAPILYASRVGSKTGWLPVPRLSDIKHLFLTISAQNHLLLYLYVLVMSFGLCVAFLASLPQGKDLLKRFSLLRGDETTEKQWQQRSLQFLPLAIILACWLLCPVIISYIVSQKSTRLFSTRYLVVIVPAFVLLTALGIAALRWRVVQVVLGLCLVLLCLYSVPSYYNSSQVEDWRTSTQWLQQRYQPGDGLICYDNSNGCAVDIEYYLQAYPHGNAHFDANSPGYFPWVDYDTTNRLGKYQEALDINAIQAYSKQHARLFYAIGRVSPGDPPAQPVIHWLNTHYELLAQGGTSTLTIYLYETTTSYPHLVQRLS